MKPKMSRQSKLDLMMRCMDKVDKHTDFGYNVNGYKTHKSLEQILKEAKQIYDFVIKESSK